MKVYDKEIYNRQESLKTVIIFIVVFLLGFFAGYITNSFTKSEEIENNTNSTYIVEQ